MSANQQMKNMLDQLMGTNRDGENKSGVKFSSSKVCRSFLLNCCPHDILSATRMDIGKCPRIHDVALRADYLLASKEKDYFFDIDATEHLERFIADCDKNTEEAKVRLLETQEELSAEVTQKMSHINALSDKIGQKLAKAEEKGEAGLVEESMKLMEEVELIRKEKLTAEQEYRNSMPSSNFQQQKLRVCEVCSAYLGIYDNDNRLADHFGGKLHLGFIEIRDKLAKLQENVEQRRVERRNAYNRSRERSSDDSDEEGEGADELRRPPRSRQRRGDSSVDRSVSDCEVAPSKNALTRSLPVGMAKRSRGSVYRRPIDRMYSITKRENMVRAAVEARDDCGWQESVAWGDVGVSVTGRDLSASMRGVRRSMVGGRCGGVLPRGRGAGTVPFLPMPVLVSGVGGGGESFPVLPPLPTELLPNPEAAKLMTSSKRRRRCRRSRSSSYSSDSSSRDRRSCGRSRGTRRRRRSQRGRSYRSSDSSRSYSSGSSYSRSSRSISGGGRSQNRAGTRRRSLSCSVDESHRSFSGESRRSYSGESHGSSDSRWRRASVHSAAESAANSDSESNSSSDSGLDRRIRRIRQRDGMDNEFQQRISLIGDREPVTEVATLPVHSKSCQQLVTKWKSVADIEESTVDSYSVDVTSIPVPSASGSAAKTVFKLTAKNNLQLNVDSPFSAGTIDAQIRRTLPSAESTKDNAHNVMLAKDPSSCLLTECDGNLVSTKAGKDGEVKSGCDLVNGNISGQCSNSKSNCAQISADTGRGSGCVLVDRAEHCSSPSEFLSERCDTIIDSDSELTRHHIMESFVVLEKLPAEVLQSRTITENSESLSCKDREKEGDSGDKKLKSDGKRVPLVNKSVSREKGADMAKEHLSSVSGVGVSSEESSRSSCLVAGVEVTPVNLERSREDDNMKQSSSKKSDAYVHLHNKRNKAQGKKIVRGSTLDVKPSPKTTLVRPCDTDGSVSHGHSVERLKSTEELLDKSSQDRTAPGSTITAAADGKPAENTARGVVPLRADSEGKSRWCGQSSDDTKFDAVCNTVDCDSGRRQASASNKVSPVTSPVADLRSYKNDSVEEELDYEYECTDDGMCDKGVKCSSPDRPSFVSDSHNRDRLCMKSSCSEVEPKYIGRSSGNEAVKCSMKCSGNFKEEMDHGESEISGGVKHKRKRHQSPHRSSKMGSSFNDSRKDKFKLASAEERLGDALEREDIHQRQCDSTADDCDTREETDYGRRQSAEVVDRDQITSRLTSKDGAGDYDELLRDDAEKSGNFQSKSSPLNSERARENDGQTLLVLPRATVVAPVNDEPNETTSMASEFLPVPGSRQALRRLQESRSVLLAEIGAVQSQIDSVCSLGQRRVPAAKKKEKSQQRKRRSSCHDQDSQRKHGRHYRSKYERRARKRQRHQERRRRSCSSPRSIRSPSDLNLDATERPQLTDWFDVERGGKQSVKSSISIKTPVGLTDGSVQVENREEMVSEKGLEVPVRIADNVSPGMGIDQKASKHRKSGISKPISKMSKQLTPAHEQKMEVPAKNDSAVSPIKNSDEQFAQLISAVYRSNDLSNSVKYEIISRLGNNLRPPTKPIDKHSSHDERHEDSTRHDHLASLVQLNKQLISMLMSGVMSKVNSNLTDSVGTGCSSDPLPAIPEPITKSSHSDRQSEYGLAVLPTDSTMSVSTPHKSRQAVCNTPDTGKISRLLQSPSRLVSMIDNKQTATMNPTKVADSQCDVSHRSSAGEVSTNIIKRCHRGRHEDGEEGDDDNKYRHKRSKRYRSTVCQEETLRAGKKSRQYKDLTSSRSATPVDDKKISGSHGDDHHGRSRERDSYHRDSSRGKCGYLSRDRQRSYSRERSVQSYRSSRSRDYSSSSYSDVSIRDSDSSEHDRKLRYRRGRYTHSSTTRSERPATTAARCNAVLSERGRHNGGSVARQSSASAARADRQWRPLAASTKNALWTPRNPLDRCSANDGRVRSDSTALSQPSSSSAEQHKSRQQPQCKVQ